MTGSDTVSVGGDSWSTAAAIDTGSTSDPSPISAYPVGTTKPYYSAWWKFTAPSTGVVTLDTEATTGTDPDTQVYVYSGTEGSPVEVAFDDDSGLGYLSRAYANVSAGVEYHVQVGTYDSTGSGVTAYGLTLSSVTDTAPMPAGADAWFGTRLTNLPATTAQTTTAAMTDDQAATTYGLHRAAWWYVPKQKTALELVIDISGSIGDTANVGIVVLAAPPGLDGAMWSQLTLVADNLASDGHAVLVPVDADRIYTIGVGVKLDDASVTSYQMAATYPVRGGWRDDSEPTWITTGATNSGDTSSVAGFNTERIVSGDPATVWNQAVTDVWGGAYDSLGTTPGGASDLDINDLGAPDGVQAFWSLVWLTLDRADSGSASAGVLPAGVLDETGQFLDPNVVGVEWEPSSTPTDQRLVVEIVNDFGGWAVTPGTTAYVKLGQADPVTVPYSPGYETAASVAARDTLGTLAITSFTTAPEPAVISALPISMTGPASLAVAVIDENTQTTTPPAYRNSGRRAKYPAQLTLQAAFEPRFRLIYRTAPTSAYRPHQRARQRGDGYGSSSTPRLRQNSSRQGTMRARSFD